MKQHANIQPLALAMLVVGCQQQRFFATCANKPTAISGSGIGLPLVVIRSLYTRILVQLKIAIALITGSPVMCGCRDAACRGGASQGALHNKSFDRSGDKAVGIYPSVGSSPHGQLRR